MNAGAMVAIHAATAAGALIEAGVMRAVDSRGRLTILGDSIDRVAGYYLGEPLTITASAASS